MNEILEVTQKWHRSIIELPEEGREVLGVCYIDEDSDDGYRFNLMSNIFYFQKGTILKVEPDRKFQFDYPGKPKKSPEEKLLAAIFGDDDDLQEIEKDGWYTFDSLNEEELMRYRRIREEPVYWCYPIMPDGIEINWRADRYEHNQRRN